MKKRFFLSLIAAIVITIGASAQNNNSYSMVLTLANGTTVTIGPNELLNIAFNNGEVNFSGESIENMVKGIESNKDYIYKNTCDIQELASKTNDLIVAIEKENTKITAINENLLTLDDVKKLIEDEGLASAASVKDLEAQIATLQAQIAELANQDEALKAQVAYTNDYNQMLEKRISDLEKVVENLLSGGQ